jgi:transcriptional regulator with XRE-family HTH domain
VVNTVSVDRADDVPEPDPGTESEERRPQSLGQRLRTERARQKIGLRELARRVNVSASLISQVELGKATPSVGTLYAIVNELGLSLDELFFEANGGVRATAAAEAMSGAAGALDASPPLGSVTDPVVPANARKAIQLDSGVRWERLTPTSEHGIDFLYVVYDVGGASCKENVLMRHSGKEYGHVLKGRLHVTVAFDTYELGPGDSISFDSTQPHRLFNPGDEPAEGLWFVVGRRDDSRFEAS